MAKYCNCCGKRLGLSSFSTKTATICGKCYTKYTGTGKRFTQKLKIEDIQEVVQGEGASIEAKPFIIELLEIPLEGIMKSSKKTLKWAIIFFILAVGLTLLTIDEPIKYLRDGAKVQFDFVDEERKWVNTDSNYKKYEITDYYEAEKDGQIIRLTETYYEYTDYNDNYVKTEGNEITPLSSGGECRIYRKDGKWRVARNSDPQSILLLSLFPVVFFAFTGILLVHYFKIRKA